MSLPPQSVELLKGVWHSKNGSFKVHISKTQTGIRFGWENVKNGMLINTINELLSAIATKKIWRKRNAKK